MFLLRFQDGYSLGAFSLPLQIQANETARQQRWRIDLCIRLFHDILTSVSSAGVPESTDWLYWYSILHEELPFWLQNKSTDHDEIRALLHTFFFLNTRTPSIFLHTPFEIRYQAFLHILQSLPILLGLDMVFTWLEKETLRQEEQVKLLKACMSIASDTTMELVLHKMDMFFKTHHVADRCLPVAIRSIRSTSSSKKPSFSFNDTIQKNKIIERG